MRYWHNNLKTDAKSYWSSLPDNQLTQMEIDTISEVILQFPNAFFALVVKE